MNSIIEKTKEIVLQYEEKRIRTGLDYNIFSILNIERNEVSTHSVMLYTLLKFTKDRKKIFLNEFFDIIGLPNEFIEENWEVIREHSINDGRIDFFLKSKKTCIVIELKIDATDQYEQLWRYEKYVKNYHKNKDYRILYLTLDGKEATEQSIRNINVEKLQYISFSKHILTWLEKIIKVCEFEGIEDSFIKQYRLLIEKIITEDNVKNMIEGFVTDVNDFKACIQIEKSLIDIKGEVFYKFLKGIKESIKREKPVEYELESAKDYFYARSKQAIPYIIYKIHTFKIAKEEELHFCLNITLDPELYYSFGFYSIINGEYEILNSNDISNSQKRIYNKCSEAVNTVLETEIRENGYKSLFYKCICDSNQHKYNFKKYSENCIELFDEDYRNNEAERIASEMKYYIKELKKYFSNNT